MQSYKQHILTLIGILILLIPNLACMVLSTDLTYSWIKEVGYLGVVLFCLMLPMTFLRRRTYFILEGILGLFWIPIEVSSLYLNKMTTSSNFIGIIVETNSIEATELLLSIWPIVVAILILWGGYIVLLFFMDNNWILPKRICHLAWWATPVVVIMGMIAVYIVVPPKKNLTLYQSLYEATDKLVMKFYKIYPYDIYISAHKCHREKEEIRRLQQHVASFRFNLSKRHDTQEEHYILILGEAARYDHFHINGYERQTSPSLDTISGLYSLHEVYSEANLTRNAIPLIVTRADAAHTEIGASERCIAEAYHEAGYQTAWYSTQPLIDITRRMYSEMDYQYAAIAGLDGGVGEPDMVLAEKTDQLFTNHPACKSFYLLHTLGSHLKYDQRYPIEYKQFVPAIEAKDGYSVLSASNKEKVVNAYDNTILYTDHVIASVINILRQQPGIKALVYLSDHGENLFDDERELSVHGSYEGTVYEAHVPCFVWLSEEFEQAYPEKVAALKANLNKQVQSDILFYTLADLGGLEEIEKPEKSVFSPALIEQDTIHMLTGSGDMRIIKIKD